MATYEYACDECGDFLAQFPIGEASETEICGGCGKARPRRYSMAPTQIMHSHWNTTAQAEVSDLKGFDEILRKQSDTASERLGLEHNFERIDVQEMVQEPVD